VRDVSGALARQSLLVAGLCVVVDLGVFLIVGPSLDNWRVWLLVIVNVLAEAGLAAPPRFSGVVAIAHGVLLAVGPLVVPGTSRRTIDNAGVLIAGYRAGAWLRTGPAVMALAALMGGAVIHRFSAGGQVLLDWRLCVLDALTSGLLPWLVGRHTTARRAYIADVEQRRAETVLRAVAEERSAIARDLHDVISHHVSAIGMHAGAARLGLNGSNDSSGSDGSDAPVRRSLAAVESASRSAMADLRRLLNVLHRQGADVQRQPGLENLGELLDGLPARLVTYGKRRELPGSVDIALYRIAQEALTNALRHGNGDTIEVELGYHPDEVALSVTNTLAQQEKRNDEPRHGLAGIRQRVALYGGHLSYGPDGGTWRLRAAFPLEKSCP